MEFYEVLGDVLERHELRAAQLAQLIQDKDSLVPKWLRGERVPQVDDLDLIVSAIDPSASELKELQVARRYSALKEALSRPKLGLSPSAIDQQLRTLVVREYHPGMLLVPVALDEELSLIRRLRLEGRPMQALGAMEVLSRQVKRDFTSLRSRKTAPLLGDYFKERLSLTVNTAVPGSVYRTLEEDVGQLVELGQRVGDRELTAHAYFRAGDAHHLDLNPDGAVPMLERAHDSSDDLELRARCLSIMLITTAKRARFDDKRRFNLLRARAETLAEQSEGDNTIGLLWLLNELGHSLSRLGEVKAAEDMLDLAWSTFERLEAGGLQYKNLRLALRRASIVAASHGAYGMSGEELLRACQELKEEALEGNYPRIVLDATKVEEEVMHSGR